MAGFAADGLTDFDILGARMGGLKLPSSVVPSTRRLAGRTQTYTLVGDHTGLEGAIDSRSQRAHPNNAQGRNPQRS